MCFNHNIKTFLGSLQSCWFWFLNDFNIIQSQLHYIRTDLKVSNNTLKERLKVPITTQVVGIKSE